MDVTAGPEDTFLEAEQETLFCHMCSEQPEVTCPPGATPVDPLRYYGLKDDMDDSGSRRVKVLAQFTFGEVSYFRHEGLQCLNDISGAGGWLGAMYPSQM